MLAEDLKNGPFWPKNHFFTITTPKPSYIYPNNFSIESKVINILDGIKLIFNLIGVKSAENLSRRLVLELFHSPLSFVFFPMSFGFFFSFFKVSNFSAHSGAKLPYRILTPICQD